MSNKLVITEDAAARLCLRVPALVSPRTSSSLSLQGETFHFYVDSNWGICPAPPPWQMVVNSGGQSSVEKEYCLEIQPSLLGSNLMQICLTECK